MDAAERAGFNRGSADKLAGRISNDSVPPKYRTTYNDRRAYKRGYKRGYEKTRTASTGAERELTSSEGIIKQVAIEGINGLITSGVSGDVFVEKSKPIYEKAATDADDISRKYGRFDPKYIKQEIGAIIYGKALEMKASPESLGSISFMATAEQIAATPKAQPAPAPAAPTVSEQPRLPSFTIRPTAFALLKPEVVSTRKPLSSTVAESPKALPPPPAYAEPRAAVGPVPMPVSTLAIDPRSMALMGPAATGPTPPGQPSWFANNWYWLVGGAAVVAGGGYYMYARNKRPS